MSVRGISAMLKRMNFSFTKATYTLAKADKQAQAFFRKITFVQLKEQVEVEAIDHLLFEDESMIRSYQALQYNWFPRGKQRKVPTYGKHEGAKLFGAINYETGQVHHREEEKADVAAFIRFLQDLLSASLKERSPWCWTTAVFIMRPVTAFFEGTSASASGLSATV